MRVSLCPMPVVRTNLQRVRASSAVPSDGRGMGGNASLLCGCWDRAETKKLDDARRRSHPVSGSPSSTCDAVDSSPASSRSTEACWSQSGAEQRLVTLERTADSTPMGSAARKPAAIEGPPADVHLGDASVSGVMPEAVVVAEAQHEFVPEVSPLVAPAVQASSQPEPVVVVRPSGSDASSPPPEVETSYSSDVAPPTDGGRREEDEFPTAANTRITMNAKLKLPCGDSAPFAREVRRLCSKEFNEDPLGKEKGPAVWKLAIMTDKDNVKFLGFAVYRVMTDLQSFSIAKIAVPAALRGRGYGGRLLSALRQAAMGCRGVHHISLSALPKSVAFYERHGFVARQVKSCVARDDLAPGQVYMEAELPARPTPKKTPKKAAGRHRR